MSKYIGEETFLDKIKAKRVYADRQSSSSSDSSADASVRSTVPTYSGISVKSHIRKYSNSDMDNSATDFRLNDTLSESEEENDRVPEAIDFSTLNGSLYGDRTLANLSSDTKEQQSDAASGNLNTLPCDILFVDVDGIIKRFNNFDEISEYLVNASVTGRDTKISAEKLKKLTKVPLRVVDHYITIGMYLKRLYEHDFLMDVVIEVAGQTFYAHRIALCCYSDYFAELFRKSNARKIPFEVKVNGVSAEAFAAFIEFCYTGDLKVYPGIASDILIVADYLKVRALKARCSDIIKSLPLEQALKIMVKTKVNQTSKLYNSLYSNIMENFSAAMKFDNFLLLDLETFCKMIGSDDLIVSSEYELFTIAVRWIIHDVDERVKHTVRVMSHVRFTEMAQSELMMCAETTSLVRGYDKFREMILIANWIISAEQAGRQDSFNFPRSKPRNCFLHTTQSSQQHNSTTNAGMIMPPPIMTSTPKSERSCSPVETSQKHTNFVDILVVGGFVASPQDITSTNVDRYDVEDNQWLHFCGLPSPRRHHAVVTMDNDIYMIGGCEPFDQDAIPNPTNTVYRMNLTTKQWTQVADMNVHRHSHGACSVDGLIYVIGGKGKHDSVIVSAECYDPQTGAWQFVPSLPEPLYAASVASLGDKIFVAGGLSSSDEIPSALHVLSSVYCYDTLNRSWSQLNDLRFPRCHASLVNVNDRLFLCGGATRTHCVQNSVLCSTSNIDEYTPANGAWIHVSDMVIPRHDAGVAVAGSRIYLIGGISTPADRVLQSIECYDVTTSAWIPGVQDLPYPARWICCCSVPCKYNKPTSPLLV